MSRVEHVEENLGIGAIENHPRSSGPLCRRAQFPATRWFHLIGTTAGIALLIYLVAIWQVVSLPTGLSPATGS